MIVKSIETLAKIEKGFFNIYEISKKVESFVCKATADLKEYMLLYMDTEINKQLDHRAKALSIINMRKRRVEREIEDLTKASDEYNLFINNHKM